jgi:hypothetical protein
LKKYTPWVAMPGELTFSIEQFGVEAQAAFVSLPQERTLYAD